MQDLPPTCPERFLTGNSGDLFPLRIHVATKARHIGLEDPNWRRGTKHSKTSLATLEFLMRISELLSSQPYRGFEVAHVVPGRLQERPFLGQRVRQLQHFDRVEGFF